MNQTYFVLKIDDSMFKGLSKILIERKELSPSDAKKIIKEDSIISCCNRNDGPTFNVMSRRFAIDVLIPDKPNYPSDIRLSYGDRILVMSVSLLRTITDSDWYRYTDNEVASAKFLFSLYTIVSNTNIY